jgi:hypothetical protein
MTTIYFILLLTALAMNGWALATKQRFITLLFIYLLSSLVVAVLAIYVRAHTKSGNNLFLFHIFTPAEYTLLSLVYYTVLSGPKVKKAVLVSIPVFIGLSVFFSLFVQGPLDNNSYIGIIESILLICQTLLFLREVLLLKQVTALYRYPLFWISTVILVYFTETLVIEGLLDYLIRHSMELALQAYMISYIFKYLLFLALTVGAWFVVAAGSGGGTGKDGTTARGRGTGKDGTTGKSKVAA